VRRSGLAPNSTLWTSTGWVPTAVTAFGHLDADLFFLAYQRDTRTQFIRINSRLAAWDKLNEYTRHTSSAHFVVPPGIRDASDYWARALLA